MPPPLSPGSNVDRRSAAKPQNQRLQAGYKCAGLTLALGGGFSRGFAHLGVLEVLEQAQIPVCAIVGTSIGGLLGAAYADGISVRELCDLGRRVRVRDFLRFHKTGHAEEKQRKDCIGQFVQEWFHAGRLEELSIPTAIVTTDLDCGAPYVFTRGPIEVAIRATCAFPGLVKPVEYEGRLLADGCIVAPVPTAIASGIYGGYVLGVSVDSNASSSCSAENVIEEFDRRVCTSHGNKLEPTWSRHADVLLEPQVRHIGWNDFSRVNEAFSAGAEAMRRALPSFRELLARRTQLTAAPDRSLIEERELAL